MHKPSPAIPAHKRNDHLHMPMPRCSAARQCSAVQCALPTIGLTAAPSWCLAPRQPRPAQPSRISCYLRPHDGAACPRGSLPSRGAPRAACEPIPRDVVLHATRRGMSGGPRRRPWMRLQNSASREGGADNALWPCGVVRKVCRMTYAPRRTVRSLGCALCAATSARAQLRTCCYASQRCAVATPAHRQQHEHGAVVPAAGSHVQRPAHLPRAIDGPLCGTRCTLLRRAHARASNKAHASAGLLRRPSAAAAHAATACSMARR
jgi:hypothetical protein